MCGIAGMVRFGGLRPAERGIGYAMADSLRHRGPDDSGHYVDNWASLGHARLSIIDLETGRQPIANEDGTIHVVFNGEIYNHQSLAEKLRSRGHQLRTRSDTEVIVHLYEDFGESFVEHLNGMFAIALWDSRKHKLVLVRDRLGIKPLYWHTDGRRVVFGSELKALLVTGDITTRVDPCALTDYLTFGHVPAPRTIFDGICKLEPGFMAICTEPGVSLRQYWDIPFEQDALQIGASAAQELSDRERTKWIDEFADVFEDAVAMRLLADVKVGAFLSGGVDSGTVVAGMCRRSTGQVMTQTVGFDEADHDERLQARQTASQLGTDHHEVMVQADAAWAAEQLVHHFDEPFADPCAVPMLYLSRVAVQRVKVALSGDGGDEMLAGYRRYRFDLAESALRRCAPGWLRRSTAGVAGWLYPKGDWLPRPLRAKRTLQNIACDDVTGHLRSVSMLAGELPQLMLEPDVAADSGDHDPFSQSRELFARCKSPALLNRLLYVDMKTLMVDGILTKVDRASMAVGLEVRVPLLDHRVVELSARMPVSLKLAGNEGKYVLRQVSRSWLKTGACQRPKKGFDVPTDAWFRGPLRDMTHDLIMSSGAVSRQWLNPRAVEHVMGSHERGLRAHGQVLWALLSLELWARKFADQSSRSQPCLAQDMVGVNSNESEQQTEALALRGSGV